MISEGYATVEGALPLRSGEMASQLWNFTGVEPSRRSPDGEPAMHLPHLGDIAYPSLVELCWNDAFLTRLSIAGSESDRVEPVSWKPMRDHARRVLHTPEAAFEIIASFVVIFGGPLMPIGAAVFGKQRRGRRYAALVFGIILAATLVTSIVVHQSMCARPLEKRVSLGRILMVGQEMQWIVNDLAYAIEDSVGRDSYEQLREYWSGGLYDHIRFDTEAPGGVVAHNTDYGLLVSLYDQACLPRHMLLDLESGKVIVDDISDGDARRLLE